MVHLLMTGHAGAGPSVLSGTNAGTDARKPGEPKRVALRQDCIRAGSYREASRNLERALGLVQSDAPTAEFYRPQPVQTQQQQRG
jgi:hypothetical protein